MFIVKKLLLFLPLIIFLNACSNIEGHRTQDTPEAKISVSGKLIANYQKDFSYLNIYEDGSNITVYAYSEGVLDEPSTYTFISESEIDNKDISVKWLNFEKKEVIDGESPSYVKVKIEHQNTVLFDKDISLIEQGLKKADKSLQEIPNYNSK